MICCSVDNYERMDQDTRVNPQPPVYTSLQKESTTISVSGWFVIHLLGLLTSTCGSDAGSYLVLTVVFSQSAQGWYLSKAGSRMDNMPSEC